MSHECELCGLTFETNRLLLDHFNDEHIQTYVKHGNRKVEIDGFLFDSALEADRYQELKLREKAGDLWDLAIHPKYLVHDKFRHNGKTIRAIHYEADFEYKEPGNDLPVVEDTKGHRTGVFKIKRKLFLKRYGMLYDYRIL